MSHETAPKQEMGRFARWRAKRAARSKLTPEELAKELAAEKIYNLAVNDLKTASKLLDKYGPERTKEEKKAAADKVNPHLQSYFAGLLRGYGHIDPKNKIYDFIATHLKSVRLIPEVRKFLASSVYGNVSLIDTNKFRTNLQTFWDHFHELTNKQMAQVLTEILTLGHRHPDYIHVVDLFQNSLSHNAIHILLNNSYLPATSKQELVKLVFTSRHRNAEAFEKILFSENSKLTAAEIRAALPNKAEDLPQALTAAFRNSLNSSTMKLSDKFFALDILSKYNEKLLATKDDVIEQDAQVLQQNLLKLYKRYPLDEKALNDRLTIDIADREKLDRSLALIMSSEALQDYAETGLPNFTTVQKLNAITTTWLSLGMSIDSIPTESEFDSNPNSLNDIALIGAQRVDQIFYEAAKLNAHKKGLPAPALTDELKSSFSNHFSANRIHLDEYLSILNPNDENYERDKRAAFDYALTNDRQKTVLAKLALLPNDPYGARNYLEEKNNPGFWSRVSRKLFWWTNANKKEIQLTESARDILSKPQLPVVTYEFIPQEEQENIVEEIQFREGKPFIDAEQIKERWNKAFGSPAKTPASVKPASVAAKPIPADPVAAPAPEVPANTIKGTFQKVLTQLKENNFALKQVTSRVSYEPVFDVQDDPTLLNSSTEDSPRDKTNLVTAIDGLHTPPLSGSPEPVRDAAKSAVKDVEHISREGTPTGTPTDPADKPQPLSAQRKRNAEARGTNRALFGNHG